MVKHRGTNTKFITKAVDHTGCSLVFLTISNLVGCLFRGQHIQADLRCLVTLTAQLGTLGDGEEELPVERDHGYLSLEELGPGVGSSRRQIYLQ